MHECPVEGCTRRVRYHKLMCADHWRMVSRTTQEEIYRWWRLLPHSYTHRELCAAAVAEVNAQLASA